MSINTNHTFPGWRKSTRSGNGGNCVEVAQDSATVGVRDSKNPTGPVLVFSTGSWNDFIAAAKLGAFDR
jgi:hypothetical protein